MLKYQSYIDLYLNHFSILFKRSKIFLIYFNELSFRVVKKNISNLLLFFKIDWLHLFSICIDIIAVDQPGKKYRFTIIYYLLSIFYNVRIQIFTQTTALAGLDTISMLYKSANWSEREVWDLFGIIFWYHPDLRRILTDYGFSGFPLRKDFPLTGFKELIYSDFSKKTKYRKVEIAQEFRTFFFFNPWINLKK